VTADRRSLESADKARILVISEQHRDSLAALVEELGWEVVAARRSAGVERRLVESGASAALVDLRGGHGALNALRRLASHVPTVAISERGDDGLIDDAIAAGAVQILLAPVQPFDMRVGLRLALRRSATAFVPRMPEFRDNLTGLRDARAVRGWIAERLAGEGARPISTLLISISRFDTINTAFGVDAGDRVLRSIAHRIEPLLADLGMETLAARNTGAEFVVCIAHEIAPTRLMLLAEAIAETIERPISTGTDVIRLGCRIGAVPAHAEDRDAQQLLKRASLALAEAKQLEQGRIHMVSDGSPASSVAAALQADLRLGLMRGEIETLFQPQVSMIDGKIIGVEALARWRHPIHGELGAATLFSVAEQSDYMLELSAHVQRKAAEVAAKWPKSLSHLRLSINVTAEDIARPAFVSSFLAMIDESGFPRDRLTVEITETGLMEDLVAASIILAALRAEGCRVAIDDFGTGYSSLAYLKALPLDYLKIDRGLSVDIEGSTRDSVVVRGVIDMARSLGLAVIAEGVETEVQLDLLAQEGCNYYQGFLCAEPLRVPALEQIVTTRR